MNRRKFLGAAAGTLATGLLAQAVSPTVPPDGIYLLLGENHYKAQINFLIELRRRIDLTFLGQENLIVDEFCRTPGLESCVVSWYGRKIEGRLGVNCERIPPWLPRRNSDLETTYWWSSMQNAGRGALVTWNMPHYSELIRCTGYADYVSQSDTCEHGYLGYKLPSHLLG